VSSKIDPSCLARAYDGPQVFDYGAHRADQLVLATGAGLMLAAMDVLNARWCVDIGGQRGLTRHRDWLAASAQAVERVWLIGWFTVTDPGSVFDVVRECVPAFKVTSYTHPEFDHGTRYATFPGAPTCT
jgi:hypothetical protein